MCTAQLYEDKIFLQYLEMVLKCLQLYSERVMTLCSSQDYAGDLKRTPQDTNGRKGMLECSRVQLLLLCSQGQQHLLFTAQATQYCDSVQLFVFPPALGSNLALGHRVYLQSQKYSPPHLLFPWLFFTLYSSSYLRFSLHFPFPFKIYILPYYFQKHVQPGHL